MKRILIVSVNAIGDTFLSLSAMESMNKIDGKVKIDFIISDSSKFLFDPLIDINVVMLKNKNIIAFSILLLRLRKIKYDYVFNFFPGRINSILTFISNGKIKAGYFNYLKIKEWHNKVQLVKIIGKMNLSIRCWDPTMSYLQRIEIVLKAADPNSFVNSKYKYLLKQDKTAGNYIIIHPFSKSANRALSFNTTTILARDFVNYFNKRIIIIGASNEFKDDYLDLQNQNLVELRFVEKVEDLATLIFNSFLYIGVDSFPLHIADSYNSNFIGIFGPTDPNSVLINNYKSVRHNCDSLFTFDTQKIVSSILDKLEIF